LFIILGLDPQYSLNDRFQEKIVKSRDVFGKYSSGNVPILVSTITAVTPRLGQVRDFGGGARGDGKALISCVLIMTVGEQ
jgi:hypothetical protein